MASRIIVDIDVCQVIGTPDYEFKQTYEDSCAIKSQQIILKS